MAMAHEGPARARYRELRERLAPKAALIALACKLLRIAWACVHHQTPYDARRAFARSLTAAVASGAAISRDVWDEGEAVLHAGMCGLFRREPHETLHIKSLLPSSVHGMTVS
ncbi:hypothetical protein TPY_2123 [Sulfobacillus acidophilus TPY]|nr:hypothetical protein TPY_2123 [Sulfobacillus acidophilus TPY]